MRVVVFMVVSIFLQWSWAANNDYYEKSPYYLIRDNLYANREGELFYRTFNFIAGRMEVIFVKRFGMDLGQHPPNKKLSQVIDADTWMRIGNSYYRDKNHFYCIFQQTFTDVLIPLWDFNPKNIQYLDESGWHGYEEMMQKFNHEANRIPSQYVSDGEHVYHLCEKIEGADYESFRLDENTPFFAHDKNHAYDGSKVQPKNSTQQ